jgi:soluble lytic murein transglycosylase-like protein
LTQPATPSPRVGTANGTSSASDRHAALRRRRQLLLGLVALLVLVAVVAVATNGNDDDPPSERDRRGGLPAFVQDAQRRELVPAFERAARAERLPIALLEALAWRESQWDASIVNPTSGAVGIGQLLPETATFVATQLLGDPDLDPTDAQDNIRLTARYLRALSERFDGDVRTGLAAYLQGSTSVANDGVTAQTAAYVDQIMTLRDEFADAARGTEGMVSR